MTLNADTSQLVIGATGNIGPHLIRQLAQMGAKTIVTVSRNPGSRLAELTQSLDATGTNLIQVAADATDPAAMNALFDRFGTDLPPLEGIYLAAFAGRPVLLSEMTDDDVAAMFRPKLDAAALLHRLSLKHACAALCFVLLDLRTDRFAVAGPLHRNQRLPGHPGLCPSRDGAAGHCRFLGIVEVAG